MAPASWVQIPLAAPNKFMEMKMKKLMISIKGWCVKLITKHPFMAASFMGTELICIGLACLIGMWEWYIVFFGIGILIMTAAAWDNR